MRPFLISLLSTVQLTRLANAFAGVANLWFVILWTRATPLESGYEEMSERPLPILLGLGIILGVGISTYAGSLNDVFDARRDQVLSPTRPIPSGRISIRSAALIGFISLLLAMMTATLLGLSALKVCLICATLILVFHTTTRHLPGFSVITVAAIYASQMLMMNVGMRFIWPILLIMIHASAVYVAAHRLEGRGPKFRIWSWVGAGLGMLGLGVLMWLMCGHEGPLWEGAYSWIGLSWPLALAVLFLISSIHKTRFASSREFASEKLQRYGSLWIGLYGVAWLLGAQMFVEALILGSLVTLGVLWMLLVRDLGAWIEQPVQYRW